MVVEIKAKTWLWEQEEKRNLVQKKVLLPIFPFSQTWDRMECVGKLTGRICTKGERESRNSRREPDIIKCLL